MVRCGPSPKWDAAWNSGSMNVRPLRRFLPATRKSWLLAIVAACVALGAAYLLTREPTTAAVTYVLF